MAIEGHTHNCNSDARLLPISAQAGGKVVGRTKGDHKELLQLCQNTTTGILFEWFVECIDQPQPLDFISIVGIGTEQSWGNPGASLLAASLNKTKGERVRTGLG